MYLNLIDHFLFSSLLGQSGLGNDNRSGDMLILQVSNLVALVLTSLVEKSVLEILSSGIATIAIKYLLLYDDIRIT